MSSTRRITINPVTRLEGHARIEIFLDAEGEVENAYFQVPELRGFEHFCVGRPVEEMPYITARLCGVCPAAHHLAAAKAVDAVFGVEPPSAAKKLRELMYMAHFVHSHIAHFYVLAAPDFVCGPDCDPAQRNILGLLARVSEEMGSAAVARRAEAQEAQALLGGRATHMAWCLPGGVSKGLSEADRARLEAWAVREVDFAQKSLELFQTAVLANPEYRQMILSDPYRLEAYDMGTVDAGGKVNFYEGQIRVTAPSGGEAYRYDAKDYLDHLAERVESWTYLKFPYLKKVGWKGYVGGADSGLYRATPLSRLNAADGMATPGAQAAYEAFYGALGGKPVHATLATHWARLIELLYAAERWLELARDPEITSNDIRVMPRAKPGEGIGSVEAPRGTLTHHYTTDEKGLLTSVNLLVGTTNNYAAMAVSIRMAARSLIHRGVEVTEGICNRIEMAFRAYDPCMSCATHSLPGQMPMLVTVRDAQGTPVQVFAR